LGRVYLTTPEAAFLPAGAAEPRGDSEQTAREGDLEGRAIVQSGLPEVRTILENGRPAPEGVLQRVHGKGELDKRGLLGILEEDGELLEIREKSGSRISAGAKKSLLEHPAHAPPMVDQITTRNVESPGSA